MGQITWDGVIGRFFVRALALIAAGLWAGPPGAATRQVDSGSQLIAATGVDVSDAPHDVDFADGTCADVFDDCTEASDVTLRAGS
ncbi:MAG: hypothetical protein V2I65_17610 [Paracoccaceae bacterium]|nr:hypothetical protein [Paracoccaceae bacterium]